MMTAGRLSKADPGGVPKQPVFFVNKPPWRERLSVILVVQTNRNLPKKKD
jgi:hypothetical protein